MEKIFEIKDLYVKFPIGESFFSNEKGFIHAVNGINLDIYKNEILSIVGESGCGKSTLARSILNLEEKNSGTIIFNSQNIDSFSKTEKKDFRKNCQLIFQNPFSSLNPRMNIFEILKEPLIVNGIKNKNEIKKKVLNVLNLVGLDESAISKFPHEFSGGQRQRIAIARALILNPKVIVADEPVSALDVSIQAQIINLLLELKEKLNLTIIFISHDLSVVKHISDRVAVMYLGEIIELTTKNKLFSDPLHPYTKALLSAVPQINPTNHKTYEPLEGELPSVKNLPNGCFFASRCKFTQEICKTKHPNLCEYSDSHQASCHLINQI